MSIKHIKVYQIDKAKPAKILCGKLCRAGHARPVAERTALAELRHAAEPPDPFRRREGLPLLDERNTELRGDLAQRR